ncbi:SDR family oxidoreductase [Sphingomonas sp. RB3P16]|uniref:SDR family NAD(P)-dependent oxidoreductase n=1 Tax=Parasphingomonas frigoris TaxID=3096163 RepID=UPI002FCA0D90
MVTRTVLITGGLGGIGLATAHAFAKERSCIALVDSRADDGVVCDALRSAGAEDVVSLVADVSDEAAVARSVAQTLDRFTSLDVIVNVAGTMIYRPIAELSATDWRRLLDINFVGAALYTGHALREMKTGGCVINIASVHARRTTPLVAPYAAAKAALVSLTRSAAIEGKPLGIRVNAILPGAIDTPMLRESPAIKSGAEVVHADDIGQPEDIAALACFLASAAAGFITGEDVVADGGRMGRL